MQHVWVPCVQQLLHRSVHDAPYSPFGPHVKQLLLSRYSRDTFGVSEITLYYWAHRMYMFSL